MTNVAQIATTFLGALAILVADACSNTNTPASQANTGGSGNSGGAASAGSDAGGGLKIFSPPSDPGPGGILFAASGIQAAGVDVFSPLDRNGLYHVLSMAGAGFLYLGGVRLRTA